LLVYPFSILSIRRFRSPSVLLACLALVGAELAEASAAPGLAECERRLDGEAAALCLSELAWAPGPARAPALRRLEELAGRRPDVPWFSIQLGAHKAMSAPEEAERLYRRSIESAADRRLARAEVYARAGLAKLLTRTRRQDEAGEVLKEAARVASASGDSKAVAKAAIARANLSIFQGDMEQAYVELAKVRTGNDPSLQSEYLFAFAKVTQQMGLFRETRRAYEQLADLGEKTGDVLVAASARSGLATTSKEVLSELPSPEGREEVLALARQALETAQAAERPDLEVYALWTIGSLSGDPAEARRHLERCLEVAATSQYKSFCQAALARRLAGSDPAAAEEAIQAALTLARESGDALSWTSAWHERMRLRWLMAPPDQALADSLSALDAIEELRDKQEGSVRQPGLFSTWAEDYYWLSGKLLTLGRPEEAFGVIERMRARTLTDALGLPRSAVPPARQGFASLAQVRRNLAPNEAFLSYQIAPWKDLAGDFGGGSWLLVSTRKRTRLYWLADRTGLRTAVDFLNGMVLMRDGSDDKTSPVLYRMLLGRALKELPAGIRKLVIVPDDSVHRLPFAALRPEPEGEPLAARFQISLVPSATLWLRWKNAKDANDAGMGKPALVFADPPEHAVLPARAKLGALPLARKEGKSVVAHLGGGSLLLAGEDASEARLKSGAAGGFRILHFATHSWTDDVEPEHSFVYLAPGSRDDGQLRAPEIADLDHLRGRMVVLSTCGSAAGEILRGEGVMGLARSFFLAGAHPVVASLWRIKDDEGFALFDRFYAHIADGRSVAASLQAAQRDLIDDDYPAAAWAGVVVLGDGDRVPFPEGKKRSLLPGLVVIGLLLAVAAVLRRRRATSPTPPAAPSGRPPG
jgi:CHAT domain-containing protein/tetratricopeptide (TPR) repeat protein